MANRKGMWIALAILGCIFSISCMGAWNHFWDAERGNPELAQDPVLPLLKVGLTKDIADTVLGCPDKGSKAEGRNYNFACYYYSKYSLVIKTSGRPKRIIEIIRSEK
jgi:hypothetical protein